MNDTLSQILEQHLRSNAIAEIDITTLLNAAQNVWGYIPEQTHDYISKLSGTSTAQIRSIIGFNACYSSERRGGPQLTICTGHSCSARGGLKILGLVKKEGRIAQPDIARCLGNCANAPVIKIDGVMHERVRPEKVITLLKDKN